MEIGKLNKLKVVKLVDSGAHLDGEDLGKVLLPARDVPDNCKVDDIIEVFVYVASKGVINATTKKPLAFVNTVALLKAVSIDSNGAFLGWGIGKNLFVAEAEQKQRMVVGSYYLVYVYYDEDRKRITASSMLDDYLDITEHSFFVDQEVELFIDVKTEIGWKVVVDNSHWGLIYANEVFQDLTPGERLTGYILRVRDDDKIDCTIQRPGPKKVDDLALIILDYLKKHGGFLPLTDKSDADKIYSMFGTSKKTFKKALGFLYKKRLIVIEDKGVRSVIY